MKTKNPSPTKNQGTIHILIVPVPAVICYEKLTLKGPRAAMDMSQADLAKAVHVSRQTICAIEKGDYNPTIRLCLAICHVLGKTLDELFWEEE